MLCVCVLDKRYLRSFTCSLFLSLPHLLPKTSLSLIYPLPYYSPTFLSFFLLQLSPFLLQVGLGPAIFLFYLMFSCFVFFLFADNRLRSRSPKKENNYHSTRSFSVSSCSPSLSALSFCTLFLSCSLSFSNHTRLLLLLLSQAARCNVIC